MPPPLSQDLRSRIAQAYLNGEGTRPQIAQRFHVSQASVDRFVRLFRQKGSVAPKPHAGGPARSVPDQDKPLLQALFEDNPSLTQAELAQCYREQTDRRVSQRTISRMLKRFALTRKKKSSTPPSANAPTSP